MAEAAEVAETADAAAEMAEAVETVDAAAEMAKAVETAEAAEIDLDRSEESLASNLETQCTSFATKQSNLWCLLVRPHSLHLQGSQASIARMPAQPHPPRPQRSHLEPGRNGKLVVEVELVWHIRLPPSCLGSQPAHVAHKEYSP